MYQPQPRVQLPWTAQTHYPDYIDYALYRFYPAVDDGTGRPGSWWAGIPALEGKARHRNYDHQKGRDTKDNILPQL